MQMCQMCMVCNRRLVRRVCMLRKASLSFTFFSLSFGSSSRTFDGYETGCVGDKDETSLFHSDATGVAQGLWTERAATP